jgi:hypothetical protein
MTLAWVAGMSGAHYFADRDFMPTSNRPVLIALSEREDFWTSVRDRAKANLLPLACEWVAPKMLGTAAVPAAFAIVVDVPSIADWETQIAKQFGANCYVVLIGAEAVVRSRSHLRNVVAALNVDDAITRLRLVVRRTTSTRLAAAAAAAATVSTPPKPASRVGVATIRPSYLGIPQRFSLLDSATELAPPPSAATDTLRPASKPTSKPPSNTAPSKPASNPDAATSLQPTQSAALQQSAAPMRGVLPTMQGVGESEPEAPAKLAELAATALLSAAQSAQSSGVKIPSSATETPQPIESYNRMTIAKALEDGMKIDGAIAVAIADWNSGLTLGTQGGGERLNIEVAASANCNVVKAKMTAMQTLGISGAIVDILITLDDQVHIIRPLRKYPELFYYLAFDKARGNLGLTRHRIEAIEKDLTL